MVSPSIIRQRKHSKLIGDIGPLLASLMWGGMYVVSKWSLPVIGPITLGFFRVTIGALALMVIVQVTKPTRAVPRRDWIGFGVLGMFVTITIVGQFVGTDFTNASQGSIFTMATPIFTLVLGVHHLNETMTLRKLGGVAVAVGGVACIVFAQYGMSSIAASNYLGVGLFFTSSLAWASFTVFGKSLIQRYSPVEVAAYAALASVPMIAVFLPVDWILYERPFTLADLSPSVVLAILYLGIMSTAAAWYLWYTGLKYTSAGTVSIYLFAQPAIGVGLGVLVLHESVGPLFFLGAVVMSIGIYAVSTEPT
ncbi:DMT family transporter [Natrinema sp. 74]|uniref:DMT family transporter n=1 Tax=Natrinema sp. 74 TaxID=3384159 RepID=UPI0038D48D7D